MTVTKNVTLNDGSSLEVGLTGNSGGKVIMLPIAKKSVFGQEAENLKLWGVDPELGKHFVEGLSSTFQVLFFDYEGYLFEHPKPDQLTAGNVASDFLHIADAMNVNTFSYYGYSWLALAGLQLAIRTNRLDSLIMGGFPPYRGPYQEMLTVTTKSHKQALSQIYNGSQPEVTGINTEEVDWNNVQVQMDPNQTKQFLTLYQSLMDFDDTLVQDKLVFPKLAFAGEKDTIVYGENFGKVTVDIAGLLNKHKEALKHFGWDIRILKGEMDHTKAMQPEAVLPLIKPWLVGKLLG